ncbi:MAG TPA: GNAT family N-acetyltransferase [Verrucomicrobiae bacterium]|nr:GNAT family N-acetyltransferase [Verrucomicrobiae bacterium]
MSKIQIEPAQVKHLPAIRDLAGVIWRAHYPGIISAAQIDYMLGWMYALETLEAEMQTLGICYEQLLVDGKLTGFAAFGPTREPPTFKLHKLYLHPSAHGRGLGSRLLQHCEHQAWKQGARRFVLAVNKHNTQAIEAYERNGFTVTDAVVTNIGAGFVMDDFIMAKNLEPKGAGRGQNFE